MTQCKFPVHNMAILGLWQPGLSYHEPKICCWKLYTWRKRVVNNIILMYEKEIYNSLLSDAKPVQLDLPVDAELGNMRFHQYMNIRRKSLILMEIFIVQCLTL